MRTLVIGDIHGQYTALRTVLMRANYDSENDRLIVLGDECDGGPDSYKVIDYLAQQTNVINIRSNHSDLLVNYIKTSVELPIWVNQGGYATLFSYERENRGKVPLHHAEYLHHARPYYIDRNRNVYVHGGFTPNVPLSIQDVEHLTWDRQLIEYARSNIIHDFNHVFVGHTTTVYYDSFKPLTFNNLTMMDTGAGWPGGYLSVMDVETRSVWQSDQIME
jgi:serine/threonine protein phosphatase 1